MVRERLTVIANGTSGREKALRTVEVRGPLPHVGEDAGAGRRAFPILAAIGLGAAIAGAVLLAVRIVDDVPGKPLFEDEAVTGLVAARPFLEVLETAWWERGGPPLHYLLAHTTFHVDASPYALRWLSVVFALASIPLVWDLGRRLGGHVAGGAAALVVGASSLLWVYGSFGRMYAVYVFVSTLALDLVVRAFQKRTPGAALAAALALWLVPAVHSYGMFLVVAVALVAVFVWRGRSIRAALPVALVGLALVPFFIADLRLAGRFSIGLEGESSVAEPGHAASQLLRSFEVAFGGAGWMVALGALLAVAGFVVLLRQGETAVAAVFVLAAALPLTLLFARTGHAPALNPRHIAYLAPMIAALVGVGLARMVRGLGPAGGAAALAALGVLLAFAPLSGITDPRDWSNNVLGGGSPDRALGGPDQLAAPTAWLRHGVDREAIVFPYSSLYLGALPEVGKADALPYAQSETLLRALGRVDPPVPEVFVSVPLGRSRLADRLGDRLGAFFEPRRFGGWLVIRAEGPHGSDGAALVAVYAALAAAEEATGTAQSDELRKYYETTLSVVCASLQSLGESCPVPSGSA